ARQNQRNMERHLRKVVQFACILMTLASAAFGKVNLTSPQPGSSNTAPVHFMASATSDYGNPVSSIIIYADGLNIYLTYSNTAVTSISMATGWRQIIIKAWDSRGNISQAGQYGIYVGGTASPSSGGNTSTPGGTTTFSNIDQMSGWGGCDLCAGAGGS